MLPPIASRFVAGETADAALDHAADLEDRDVGAILNRLGEHYADRASADADAEAYCALVDDIAEREVRACISVKPSQLGLAVSESVFRENLERVVDHATEREVFVWIDMEDHTTTEATLSAFRRVVTAHDGGVGVCLQANLKRTREDLADLAGLPGKVRLVKGAYDEPADIAYTSRKRINAAYVDLLEYAFEHYDGGIAVASHDPTMLNRAAELHAEFGTPYEVQMLMGVRTAAQFDLADDVPVWQYVPYGDQWFAYFYRRVRERKENLWFALRAVLGV
jgi:proline dehydrogenase